MTSVMRVHNTRRQAQAQPVSLSIQIPDGPMRAARTGSARTACTARARTGAARAQLLRLRASVQHTDRRFMHCEHHVRTRRGVRAVHMRRRRQRRRCTAALEPPCQFYGIYFTTVIFSRLNGAAENRIFSWSRSNRRRLRGLRASRQCRHISAVIPQGRARAHTRTHTCLPPHEPGGVAARAGGGGCASALLALLLRHRIYIYIYIYIGGGDRAGVLRALLLRHRLGLPRRRPAARLPRRRRHRRRRRPAVARLRPRPQGPPVCVIYIYI